MVQALPILALWADGHCPPGFLRWLLFCSLPGFFEVVLGQEAYVFKRLSVLQVNIKVAMAEEATIRASMGAMAERQSRKARPTADLPWQEERAILGAKVCPFFYHTHSPSVSSR